MSRQEREQQHTHDQRARFDKLLSLLDVKREADPAIINFDRRPHAFSLTRNGHLLIYQEGPGRHIGSGEIRARPNPDGDEPFEHPRWVPLMLASFVVESAADADPEEPQPKSPRWPAG